jgi:hypothetical protein
MQRSAILAICLGLLVAPAAGLAQQPENILLSDKDVK